MSLLMLYDLGWIAIAILAPVAAILVLRQTQHRSRSRQAR
jgi:hypothetical protein